MLWFVAYKKFNMKKYKEIDDDTVKCPYCPKLLNNSIKSVNSHIGYYHKEESKGLFHKQTQFSIKCLECDKLVANSNNTLSRHIKKEHNMEWIDYSIKHEYNGEHPVCLCKCGGKVVLAKGGFRKYIKGHPQRGSNNPMYGKKGEESPNFGKIRTEEHKKNYSETAYQRYEDYPHLYDLIRDLTIKRNQTGDLQSPKSFKKYNPFTQCEEIMNSSWEGLYLDLCISQNNPTTKNHNIRIEYVCPISQKLRTYIPDFLHLNSNKIIEIKGEIDEIDETKFHTAQLWCQKNNNFTYECFEYDIYKNKFLKIDINNSIVGRINPEEYGNISCIRFYNRPINKNFISKLNEEEKTILSNKIFKFYRKNGFPYPKFYNEILLSDLKKLISSNIIIEQDNTIKTSDRSGLRIFNHFSPHFFEAKSKNLSSMIDSFNNDEKLLSAIQNRLGITFKEEHNITGSMIRQGMRSARICAATSIFKPSIAKTIYTNYCPNNGTVFDFSMGYGQRLLGCLSTNKNIKYIGCDPYHKMINSNDAIFEFVKNSNIISNIQKPDLIHIGSEKISLDTSSIDMAFSSPPYFDQEIFSTEETQAYHNISYKDFLELWWNTTLQTIYKSLKVNGLLVLNINNKHKQDMEKYIINCGFEKIQTINMTMPQSHDNKHKTGSNIKYEPIIIYIKK